MNLLLNWEVQPENHLWHHGQCLVTRPPALVAGREHTIALHAHPGGALVFVDDVLLGTVPASLDGTVTVDPALDSEIFVREIRIDGDLAPCVPVSGPRIPPM